MANVNFFVESGALAPPWLLTGYDGSPGEGGRFQFLQGLGLDVLYEKYNQGMLSSMPGMTLTDSSLPLIGADRSLLQGPQESRASYIARLLVWRQTWAIGGNAWSILKAARAYISGAATYLPDCSIVSNSAPLGSAMWNYYPIFSDDSVPPIHWNTTVFNNWDWDSISNVDAQRTRGHLWWKSWLIIYSEAPAAWTSQWPTLGTGGQPTLGSASTASLGFADRPPEYFAALRDNVTAFVPANSWLRWILVAFDRTKLDPNATGTGGGIQPDGTFGVGFVISSGVYTATWPSWLAPVPGQPDTVYRGSKNFVGSVFGFAVQQGQYVGAPQGTLPLGYNFNGAANNVSHPAGFSFSIVNGIYTD